MKNSQKLTIRGFADQHQNKWYQCCTSDAFCFFSADEIQNNENLVMGRIARITAPILTSSKKADFKSQVEAVTKFSPKVIAASPGWHGSVYVTAAGKVIGDDADQVAVTFDPQPKFIPCGDLKSWQRDIGRVVANQDLPLFILCYSLVGPLLKFAPADVQNLQCELVSGPESGKTTLAMLAASVWCGDPNATTGGCETWDLTVNAFDRLKVEHSDGLLVLDEANLAGSGARQSELINHVIFKASTSGEKRRYTDVTAAGHSRLALLSTSNEPIATLIKGAKETKSARESRMVSIVIPERQSGVLSSIPNGFKGTRSAMEHLSEAINQNFGVAAQRFIETLTRHIEADPDKVARFIKRHMKHYDHFAKDAGINSSSARAYKLFAITYVAGLLARRWEIFPKAWGRPLSFVMQVQKTTIIHETSQVDFHLSKIARYFQENRDDLIVVEEMGGRLKKHSFNAKRGFLHTRSGRRELLIPTMVLQQEFTDWEVLMRALRDAGAARGEGGTQRKLSIKTPKSICDAGRVYCIDLGALPGDTNDR